MEMPCADCHLPENKTSATWSKEPGSPNPFITAVQNRHDKCLKAWVLYGIRDILYPGEDKIDQTALMVAAKYNLAKVVRGFLEAGCDANQHNWSSGETALLKTISLGAIETVSLEKIETVKALLEFGASRFNYRANGSALRSATNMESEELLTILLDTGGDVNEYDSFLDRTLLMDAGESGVERSMKFLLERGCKVNLQSRCGYTALFYTNSSNCIKLLSKYGAKLDIQTSDGLTALLLATMAGNTEKVDTLIQCGADVNCHGENTNTALHGAVFNGYLDIARLLLKHGAKINVKEYGLPSAMSAKIHKKNQESILLIFAAGQALYDTECKNIPELIKRAKYDHDLAHLCRLFIRRHLVKISPTEHLFFRMPKLKLPKLMTEYLLYNISLCDT